MAIKNNQPQDKLEDVILPSRWIPRIGADTAKKTQDLLKKDKAMLKQRLAEDKAAEKLMKVGLPPRPKLEPVENPYLHWNFESLEKRLASLKAKRPTIARQFGTESKEYIDLTNKIKLVDASLKMHNLPKRTGKKRK